MAKDTPTDNCDCAFSGAMATGSNVCSCARGSGSLVLCPRSLASTGVVIGCGARGSGTAFFGSSGRMSLAKR